MITFTVSDACCHKSSRLNEQITDVAIQFQWGLESLLGALAIEEHLMAMTLDIRRVGGFVRSSQDGTAYGTINNKTFDVFRVFRNVFSLLIIVNVDRTKLQCTLLDRVQGAKVQMEGELTVCGPRHLSKLVAGRLGERGMFLQHPLEVSPGFSYENPQSISVEGVNLPMDQGEADLAFHEALQSCGVEGQGPDVERLRAASSDKVAGLVADVAKLFDHVPSTIYQTIGVQQDVSISSSLLP